MMRRLPETGELDILFVTYGGGHVQSVLPVAKQLQSQGYKLSIFALTSAIDVIQSAGLPYFTYADLTEATDPLARAKGEDLAREFPSGGSIPIEETHAYLGLNYLDMVCEFGAQEAEARYQEMGRASFFPIGLMRSVLEQLKPRLLVSTNSPRSERAALEAARDCNIPSVCLVDMFALQEISWIKQPNYASKICVLNDGVRDMFIKEGCRASDVVATGNPAFDGIHVPEVIAQGAKIKHDRGWTDTTRTTVLYASTPEPDVHPFTNEPADPGLPRRVETRMRELIAQRPQLDLVIRRHPSEDQNVETGPQVFQSHRFEDVNALLYAVDLVVVTCSTVGLQAYLAGVPVISIAGSVFTKDAPFADFGMADDAKNLADLERVLELRVQALCSDQTPDTATPSKEPYQLASLAVCGVISDLLAAETLCTTES